jgi:hypothetical protein
VIVVLICLIAYAVLTLVLLVGALILVTHGKMRGTVTFAEGGLVASAAVSGLLIGIGLAVLPRSRA